MNASTPLLTIPESANLGIVIGTYGSAPFVHLLLESWRRLAPEAQLLVHDDSSPAAEVLAAL